MPGLVGQKILRSFTLLLLITQEKFQLASRSYTIVWYFTSLLILPHSDMLKFSSCKQFLTGQHLQINQGGHPLCGLCRIVCGYHHIHNKSCTNTEMLDLIHTCRIFSIGESADASGSIRNAVHVLHGCIMLSVSMQLSFDLFELITLFQVNPQNPPEQNFRWKRKIRLWQWSHLANGRICKAYM